MQPKSASPVAPPERFPDPVIPAEDLFFTQEEKNRIAGYRALYPRADAAVMRTLWLAQEKFGFLPPEVIRLVADTLEMPYAQAYGVATFYTQYYKERMGRNVLDVCTCFTCQVVGGYDALHHLEEKLGIREGETTADGLFTVREAECLGACGSGPVVQVNNGRYIHRVTPDKLDQLIDDLLQGKEPPFVSITLPQDEVELSGNRRSDAEVVNPYRTPPESRHMD